VCGHGPVVLQVAGCCSVCGMREAEMMIHDTMMCGLFCGSLVVVCVVKLHYCQHTSHLSFTATATTAGSGTGDKARANH